MSGWSSSPFKCQFELQFILQTGGPKPKASWEKHTGAGGVLVEGGGRVDGPCGLQCLPQVIMWFELGRQVLEETSRMDLEGQQLLRVHVVERAQVGQLEQQLGEDGRLVGVVLGDEASQGADQRLLQGLHRVHVLDA